MVETLTGLEQVARHIGAENVQAEPLDRAASFDDGPARLPERAPLLPASLYDARRKAECAPLWLDLAHGLSVPSRVAVDIRAAPESRCGLLLKRENGQAHCAQSHDADQRNENDGLAVSRGVLTHQ